MKPETSMTPSEVIADDVLNLQQIHQREVDRREKAKKDRDAETYKWQLIEWTNLNSSERVTEISLTGLRATLQRTEADLAQTRQRKSDLLASGFVPPEVMKPVVAEPVKVAPPAFTVPSATSEAPASNGYVRPTYAPCPNCGQEINPTVAFHRLGAGMVCILDEARARSAGISAEAIAD